MLTEKQIDKILDKMDKIISKGFGNSKKVRVKILGNKPGKYNGMPTLLPPEDSSSKDKNKPIIKMYAKPEIKIIDANSINEITKKGIWCIINYQGSDYLIEKTMNEMVDILQWDVL